MRGEAARLVFTDPPYNVAIAGNVTRSQRTMHREFAMASGEMTSAQFTEFLRRSATNLANASMDGAIGMYTMDWKHTQEMLAAGNAVYSEFKQLIVWNKDRGGLGSFYRSKHELIFVFKKGRAPHVNNFELGQHGRLRTNVWDYAGPRTNAAGANAGRDIHPTIKPVALVADAIKDTTHRGEIVLDGFAGSGTAIIAAEKTGRRARAIELDPNYVDACIRRWEAFTGGTATLSETGEAFSAVGVRRASISGPRVRRRPAVAE
nr:site-specific DNA-methyltransferase [Nitrosomonas nitrosa]